MLALYAGSFDPITNAHVDLVRRARPLFSQVLVGVGTHPTRKPLFSAGQRVELLREVFSTWAGVEVCQFDGLVADFARSRGAAVLLRGLRTTSDFEYELSIAQANSDLAPQLETVFLPTRAALSYVSASLVRELASHGADVSAYAPEAVCNALTSRRLATQEP